MTQKKSIRKLTYMALYIALIIIGNKIIAIPLPYLRIGFGFLPLMVCGYQMGIKATILVAVVADTLGVLLFPSGGAYFFGWTLTAAWSGYMYGNLYQKKITYPLLWKVVIIESLVTTTLNSIWLYMLMGNLIYADLPIRYIKLLVTIPVYVVMGKSVLEFMQRELRRKDDDLR